MLTQHVKYTLHPPAVILMSLYKGIILPVYGVLVLCHTPMSGLAPAPNTF